MMGKFSQSNVSKNGNLYNYSLKEREKKGGINGGGGGGGGGSPT